MEMEEEKRPMWRGKPIAPQTWESMSVVSRGLKVSETRVKTPAEIEEQEGFGLGGDAV